MADNSASHAAGFFKLFTPGPGHGVGFINSERRRESDGKLNDCTVRFDNSPVSEDLWAWHREKRQMLGIGPINEDGFTTWGALDFDSYRDFDHAALAVKLMDVCPQMIVAKTRSDGARGFLFCTRPVPAAAMRRKLTAIKNALSDTGKIEVFPKQDKLIGNPSWLFMPYHGDTCPAITPDGDELSPLEFLATAEQKRVDVTFFGDFYPDGPPCVNKLVQIGIGQGIQHDALYNFLVYARAKHARDDESFRADAHAFANNCLQPAGDPRKTEQMVRSFAGKEYFYRCQDQPICDHCDSRECVKREFGIPGDDDDSSPKRNNQFEKLMKLADDFECFKSGPGDDPYIRYVVGDHKEVWPATIKIEKVLRERYHENTGRAPSREALNSAVDTILIKCDKGPKLPVYIRFARSKDAIYLDLSDERWRAVEIKETGWRIISDPPVMFRRGFGAQALPDPVQGGSIEDMRPLLNARNDERWRLMVSWVIGCFLPEGGFTHLVLEGEAGSAKTTTATILRRLLDPSDTLLASPPKDEQAAIVAGVHFGLLAFDNLSGCPADLADTFCRFATGASFITRTLYETIGITGVSIKTPVILNGIDTLTTRGDLLERCITLRLPGITPDKRKREGNIMPEFEKVHAKVLGAVLNAVVEGLKNLPTTELKELPRMADFAVWVSACEPALPWAAGEFIKSYFAVLNNANCELLENDQVGAAMVSWTGRLKLKSVLVRTPRELLMELNDVTRDWPKEMERWPRSPDALGRKLGRLIGPLKSQGVNLRKLKRADGARAWEISTPGPQMVLPVDGEKAA